MQVITAIGSIFELSKTPDEISRHIQDNLSVRTSEKNKYGEVFTPLEYIIELLDQLPSRVWSDSSLRWLEPASGIGHFCVIVYSRLMDGLIDEFPDRLARHEHIIKNMLFMVEINKDNIEVSRDLFGDDANIICGDFLTPDISVDIFQKKYEIDIIIGNPPFQTPLDDDERKRNKGSKGGKILWDKFICASLDILNRQPSTGAGAAAAAERFLCFITPPAWRKPYSTLWRKMTIDNTLLFLHNINKKNAVIKMGVQQHMDIYVLRCGGGGGGGGGGGDGENCIIKTDNNITYNNIQPRDWPFLPNSDFELISGLLDLKPDPARVIYDRMAYGSDTKNMSAEYRAGEFIYPVVHTMTKRGLGLWYSNSNTRGHFGVAKVILNFNEKLYPYLDASGEYGMGQFSFGLPVTSVAQGEAIVRALTSSRFRAVVKATKWGAFQTDRRMFEYFKDGFYDDDDDVS
jgi:hypothetical protein